MSPNDGQRPKAFVSLPLCVASGECTQAASALGGRHWRPRPQQHKFTPFSRLLGLQIRYIEVARGDPGSQCSQGRKIVAANGDLTQVTPLSAYSSARFPLHREGSFVPRGQIPQREGEDHQHYKPSNQPFPSSDPRAAQALCHPQNVQPQQLELQGHPHSAQIG
jgi:hypothetical protein